MLNLIRTAVVVVLMLPVLVLGWLSLQDRQAPSELVVATLISSIIALALFLVLTARQGRLEQLATQIRLTLEAGKETHKALVEPVYAKPVHYDEVYRALCDLTEKVVKRREQLRVNLDKVSGILITLSQGRALEIGAGDFDMPDSDDKTLLLGSLCQLITTLQSSRQRGDVFANVLRESPIAMLITDATMKIRSMNPAAEKLFGYTLQQTQHHSIMEFFVPPPIQSHQSHLRQIVLPGHEAIKALQQGRQEVFTTIRSGYGKTQLIGLRASFGQHCLFVIRERSKDKVEIDLQGPDTIHLSSSAPTVPLPVSVAS